MGGLGTSIFRFLEEDISVKTFRTLPEVKQRLSEIANLVGREINTSDIGNLLHDLRQIIFLLGTNPSVDKDSLLALIRSIWVKVGGKEVEEFDYRLTSLQESNFAQTEAAALIDLFSVDSVPFSERKTSPHMDAFE